MDHHSTRSGPILAFDTSGPWLSAALVEKGVVRLARHEEMARGQAERLFVLLEEMLREAGRAWGELAALGVGIGPGNFTGIRIAVAAARGLSLALGIPAHGVSRFEALAESAPRPALLALDARRERLWLARLGADGPEEPVLVPLAEIERHPVLEGLPATAPVIGERAGEIAARIDRPARAPALTLGTAIARIAARRDPAGATPPAPLYLRPADAAPPSEPPVPILDA